MKMELASDETITGCPMCGEYASLHTANVGAFQKRAGEPINPTETLYWVKCDNKKCGVTQTAVNGRENALERWNRRAQ